MYLYIKALHIIFVVCWFAGLFYMVRLFIYHIEANERPDMERKILQDQFQIMERKLWNIITIPAMVITVASGLWMMMSMAWYTQPWMMMKLGFLVLLLAYHFKCQSIMKSLRAETFVWTSTQLRLWNEGATLLLFAIVFLVVLKNTVSWIWGCLGLIGIGVVLMIAVKAYKKYREVNS